MENKRSISLWKQTLFRNWNFMRALRLFLGSVFLVEAIQSHETFYGIAGGLFLIQAIFNWGCCGMNAYSTQTKPVNSSESNERVQFEEIKVE
jgi:hypothetical protein